MFKKLTALALVLCMLFSLNIATSAEAGVAPVAYETLVSKESYRINDGQYKVKLQVPGSDSTALHDEVILMVDGSYSGDDEWNSMVNTIVTIGETVLNGNGNTQLTLMAFGMGDNEVLVHVKDVDELASALGELPGSLLYGRSSTNNEAGFTGVAEYINTHDETLNDVHVLYISDGEVNTDETLANFYDWKNNGWHRFAEDVIITANFEAECRAIAQGANRSNAFLTVFGDGDIDVICESATYEMMDAYNAQIWADVYAEAGLDPNKEYPVSDVERAFVDYDNKHNTYIQDNFYYALVGRTYPEKTQRTIDAAQALAAMPEVDALYIIDTNRTTDWMQTVGGENFLPAGSVANILPAIESVLTDLATTPYNDVVITDYMSKWVNLDTTTIAIVDDKSGETIWNSTEGWLINEGRPTAKENPVEIELVSPSEYYKGGSETVGNQHGNIYKLTWTVKDGAMLRSDSYHLEYIVDVDTHEAGFVYGRAYAANGTTTVEYTDGEGERHNEEIDVPVVEKDTETASTSGKGGSDSVTGYWCTECGDRNCDHYKKVGEATAASSNKKNNKNNKNNNKNNSSNTWFMYNTVTLKDGESATFAMQAGNNKNKDNIVGFYTIFREGDSYYVTYELLGESTVVKDAHLSVSSAESFTGAPGKDDNQDYGEWFTIEGDTIYVFAHWTINY